MDEDRLSEIRTKVRELDKKYPLSGYETSNALTADINELSKLIAEIDNMTEVKPADEDVTTYTEWLNQILLFRRQLVERYPELNNRKDFSDLDLEQNISGTDLFEELYYPDAIPYFQAGLTESATPEDGLLAYARIVAFEPKMHEFLRESIEEHEAFWKATLREAAQLKSEINKYISEMVEMRNVFDRRTFNLEYALRVERVEAIERGENIEDLPVEVPFDEERIIEYSLAGETRYLYYEGDVDDDD